MNVHGDDGKSKRHLPVCPHCSLHLPFSPLHSLLETQRDPSGGRGIQRQFLLNNIFNAPHPLIASVTIWQKFSIAPHKS